MRLSDLLIQRRHGRNEWRDIFATSNGVLNGMHRDGTSYHWVESFVTDDAIYCVHIAPDEETVREHARCGGFPADEVMEVRALLDPTTAG